MNLSANCRKGLTGLGLPWRYLRWGVSTVIRVAEGYFASFNGIFSDFCSKTTKLGPALTESNEWFGQRGSLHSLHGWRVMRQVRI